MIENVAQISAFWLVSLSEQYSRSSGGPKKYGEGSQVLKACKPPSLVEYEYARKGGDAKVSLVGDRTFKYCNYCECATST